MTHPVINERKKLKFSEMKKIFLTFIFLIALLSGKAQENVYHDSHSRWDFAGETAFSAGIGIGGNSAFGAELQTMFLPRLSFQLGAGVTGFSGGLNYHFYPTVSSPYLSIQAWQQGFGTNYKSAYIGPMFVYRADRLLQAGLGVGYQIHKNPAVDFDSKYILMFNLGIYIPM